MFIKTGFQLRLLHITQHIGILNDFYNSIILIIIIFSNELFNNENNYYYNKSHTP